MSTSEATEVTVVGAGVIGLTVAWQAARAGHRVTLYDPDPTAAASWVAGGMLAPVAEAWPGDESALHLGLASLDLWPAFAADLTAAGHDPLLRTDGTVLTGIDSADRDVLDTLAGYLAHLGQPVDRLTGRELRRMEPLLGPAVRAGLHMPGDLAVDNRALLRGLLGAATEAGVRHVAEPVTDLAGLAGQVVLAAGAWSTRLCPQLQHLVRPIKGEILRLRPRTGSLPAPSRTIRGFAQGRPIYLVPRADGEVVLGATQYEAGFDTAPTLAGVRDLIADAELLAPALADYQLTEVRAGLRAGSVDNLPFIGRLGGDELIVATGHHRNGLLLAPVTGLAVTALLAGDPLPEQVRAADPHREGALL